MELGCAIANSAFDGEHVLRCETYGKEDYIYQEVIDEIVSSHIVVMMYPYQDGNQISYKSYNVSDCCRPLIISNTEWFYRLSGLHAFRSDTEYEIADHLIDIVEEYGEQLKQSRMYKHWMLQNNRTWEHAAQTYINAYREIFHI